MNKQEKLITLTADNLATEHICCAITEKKGDPSVPSKKAWLRDRIKEGLKFVKLYARGKIFIEYIPAENAWVPVNAPGYNIINCHWVAGSFKGKGYGKLLLDACESDSADKNGVAVIVTKKKKPFTSDKSFYLKHGYEVCDTADPYFELMVKRFKSDAPLPSFNESAKSGMPDGIKGIDLYFTAQCPFTRLYIELLKPVILASEIPVRIHEITTKQEAQSHFSPITTYSLFLNGKFHTNEILTPAKLEKIISGMG